MNEYDDTTRTVRIIEREESFEKRVINGLRMLRALINRRTNINSEISSLRNELRMLRGKLNETEIQNLANIMEELELV